MPGMGALQAIAALKRSIQAWKYPYRACHGGLRRRHVPARDCDFLQKPVSIAPLPPALMRALEKQRHEAAQAEARARTVIETAREAIVLFDREGIVRDFNPQAEQIFGLTREQAVGRNLADFAIPSRLLDVFKGTSRPPTGRGRISTNGWVRGGGSSEESGELPAKFPPPSSRLPRANS